MADRENVILGIENCLQTDSVTECSRIECPFIKYRETCLEWLLRSALALLKEQEAVKPRYIDGKRNHFIVCGNCNTDLIRGVKYCSYCGKAVKWDA